MIKFEVARIHFQFLSDVFVAVTVFVAKLPNFTAEVDSFSL